MVCRFSNYSNAFIALITWGAANAILYLLRIITNRRTVCSERISYNVRFYRPLNNSFASMIRIQDIATGRAASNCRSIGFSTFYRLKDPRRRFGTAKGNRGSSIFFTCAVLRRHVLYTFRRDANSIIIPFTSRGARPRTLNFKCKLRVMFERVIRIYYRIPTCLLAHSVCLSVSLCYVRFACSSLVDS